VEGNLFLYYEVVFMRKLRITVFFLLAALSCARAACDDFEIFINNNVSKGCGSIITHAITFGEEPPLTFIISPTDGDIRWKAENGIILATTYHYTPILLDEEDNTFNYIIERNGVPKTIIILTLQARRYIVLFDSKDGSAVDPQTVINNKTATRPSPDPTRTGYDFVDWDFNFSTPITQNITVNAIWEIQKFTVSFINKYDASYSYKQEVEYGSTATPPNANYELTREGYDFDGWDFDFDRTPITQNTTIEAKWKPKTYTIYFDTDGGNTSVPPQSVTFNSAVGTLPTPTKTGYDFKVWKEKDGTSEYTASTIYSTANSITLKAEWEIQKFTVLFKTDGSPVPPQTVEYNKTATKPPDPTRPGHTFIGWEFDFESYITENIEIQAIWEINKYTVSFNSNGGSAVKPQDVIYNQRATKPSPDPTREGYDFDGWDFNFNTPITQNITVNANWEIQKFTVLFKTNGSIVPSQIVEYYGKATKPPDPTRPGHTFIGWEFDFESYITENIEIQAIWEINKYTVSFNSNGGSAVKPQDVIYNQRATRPSPDPTRDGYDLDWDFDFDRTPITKDTTIEAKWKPKTYTITLNPQGGRFSRPADAYKSATYNEAIGALPTPIKDAYEFKGWFTEEAKGVEITSSRVYSYTANIVLYAHWEFVKGSPPTASMLQTTPPLPFSLTYNGRQAEPVEITKREDVYGEFGKITTLYNGKPERPRDAGTYRISANIEASEDYATALVENLGYFTISKRNVALSIKQALVKDKNYDAQTKAEVTSLTFETGSCEANTGLCGSDIVSPNDYELNANFEQQDAGEDIPVRITIYWLQKELYKNYILSTPPYSTMANIKKAKTILEIKVPEIYELSNPQDLQNIIEVKTNPFININRDIAWQYKGEKATEYSDIHPNRVGNWTVRAYIESTDNYTEAEDIETFLVTRGSATTVMHNIGFDEETPFREDVALSTPQKKYYVADYEPPGCKISSVKVKIEVKEADIVLKVGKIPIPFLEENKGIAYHEYPHTFKKLEPGLDTIAYSFYSLDGIYEEHNFILIERPIHFDSVTIQKWNNLFLVNNNTQKNGGYNFIDYQWFKNGQALPKDTLQFYSAGPYRTDTLDTDDKYSIQMNYAKGDEQFRISTCEGSPKQPKANPAIKNPALKKQALGINGKSAKLGAKVYNSKGERSNGTAPGVYLIEE